MDRPANDDSSSFTGRLKVYACSAHITSGDAISLNVLQVQFAWCKSANRRFSSDGRSAYRTLSASVVGQKRP